MPYTVAEAVDRAFREYLERGDDQPALARLAATVAVGATTWTLDVTGMDVSDRDAFDAGMVVECGRHAALVTAASVSGDTITLTVRPNHMGTVSVQHAAGALVKAQPVVLRQEMFDAVCDAVPRLYPPLSGEASVELTQADDYVEVPAAVVSAHRFIYEYDGAHYEADVRFERVWPASATGKAVRFPTSVPAGAEGHLLYRTMPTRPTAETDDLEALGVRREWVPIVLADAVVQTLTGRELSSTAIAYVSQLLQREGQPAGTFLRTRDALQRLRELWVEKARRSLIAERGAKQVWAL